MSRTERPRVSSQWDGGRYGQTRRQRRSGPSIGPVRLTPVRFVLLLALVGSLAYIAFAITVRDASQIPMLSSGAAVLGLVFAGLALAGAVATYRAGREGRGRDAFVNATLGGIAAIIAAGCFAGAVVLGLVWSG